MVPELVARLACLVPGCYGRAGTLETLEMTGEKRRPQQ
jgi:hypothetical protein